MQGSRGTLVGTREGLALCGRQQRPRGSWNPHSAAQSIPRGPPTHLRAKTVASSAGPGLSHRYRGGGRGEVLEESAVTRAGRGSPRAVGAAPAVAPWGPELVRPRACGPRVQGAVGPWSCGGSALPLLPRLLRVYALETGPGLLCRGCFRVCGGTAPRGAWEEDRGCHTPGDPFRSRRHGCAPRQGWTRTPAPGGVPARLGLLSTLWWLPQQPAPHAPQLGLLPGPQSCCGSLIEQTREGRRATPVGSSGILGTGSPILAVSGP